MRWDGVGGFVTHMGDRSLMARRRSGRDETSDMRPPTVLVVGTDDWAIQQAVDQLEAAGIQTVTCHPCGEPSFPCNALVEGRVCPLDAGFDLAVTVRARPDALPAPGELGVICALHAHVGLITAGIAGRNPFAPWASRSVGRADDLAAVVRDVLRESDGDSIDLRRPAGVGGDIA